MRYYLFKDFNKKEKWTKAETFIIYAYLAFTIYFNALKIKSSLIPPLEIPSFIVPLMLKLKFSFSLKLGSPFINSISANDIILPPKCSTNIC